RRAVIPVLVGKEAALPELEAPHFQEVAVGPDDHHFTQSTAYAELGCSDRHRSEAAHLRATQQRARARHSQVARGAGDDVGRAEAAGLRATWQDDHQVTADR